MKRVISGILLILLIFGMSTLTFNVQPVKSEPKTWIVDDDGPADFMTIQEAINAASPGDNIYVRVGTYYENLVVSKTVALLGENKNTTVIVGVAHSPVWESVIFVRADDVMIANLTVTNGGHGIYLGARRSIVTDCVAYGNGFGLTISSSSQNFLRRNLFFNNSYNLLVLGSWSISDFIQDIDSSNYVNGKPVYYLVNEENLSINPVTFPNVGYLAVVSSTNVQIANLSLSRNGDGLLVAFSPNTLIENVEATHNYHGISLMCSTGTTVKHCNFSHNECGIFSYYSDHVNIKENNISHNNEGIFLVCSNYGVIYHNNFIENYRYYQVCVDESHNIHWDDGYPSGGNYWSDHVCSGNPSDGSQPYIIDENNVDHYPFQDPNGWLLHQLTVTSSPITGITFTIDGVPQTSPYTEWLPEGSYTLQMPETYNGYVWSHWLEDGDTSRTKTITLPDATWTGVFAVQPPGPKAEFAAIPDTVLLGKSIKFDASASLPGWNGTHEMPITEYRWDFGGGIKITTSASTVYYSFISPGIYYVTLTVYAPGATPETDSITHKVTVISVPVGGYSFQIKGYTTTKPLTLYLALVAILTGVFTMIKRKTRKRTKR